MNHDAITNLPSGLVVDKSKLQNLDAAEMSAFFAQAYAQQKPVVIVESKFAFFNSKRLLEELEKNGSAWRLIAEHFNIELSEDEILTLNIANGIRERIAETVKAIKSPYALVPVPKDWSLRENILMDQQSVRRMRVYYGDQGFGNLSTGYSIGVRALERLWKAASAYWAEAEGAINTLSDVRAGDYRKTATFYPKYINVGCQNIARFEIEQIALAKGWEFP